MTKVTNQGTFKIQWRGGDIRKAGAVRWRKFFIGPRYFWVGGT